MHAAQHERRLSSKRGVARSSPAGVKAFGKPATAWSLHHIDIYVVLHAGVPAFDGRTSESMFVHPFLLVPGGIHLLIGLLSLPEGGGLLANLQGFTQ